MGPLLKPYWVDIGGSTVPARVPRTSNVPKSLAKEEARIAASDILKRVDHLIKSAEIDQAMREIIRAKDIDPTNGYVHAYAERLAYLKAEHEKSVERERARKHAEEAGRQRDAQLSEERKQEEQKRRQELECREEERKRMEQIASHQQLLKIASRPPTSTRLADGAMKAVQNPVIGARTQSHSNVRGKTNILRRDLPNVVPDGQQDRFNSQSSSLHQTTPLDDSIVLIEDEEDMLHALSEILKLNGYTVTALAKGDEALVLLKTGKPRLILSDIDLGNASMGGFALFEKIQHFGHLSDVPFIFLTGLTDDILLRKGKELGADDYLTKPVAEEDLIAAVKGKLKRYEQVRGAA